MDLKKMMLALVMMSLLALGACKKDESIETEEIGQNGAGEPTINTETPAGEGERQGQTAGAPGATATLQGAPEDTDFSGTITVTQEANGVRVVADFQGVDRDGRHAFHVHENGECSHGEGSGHFTSAGGHFNPTGAEHTCPPTEPRHAGDLGNVEITNGSGRVDVTTNLLSLSGPNSVIGKAIILHTGEDDCQTQPTGNAGDRLACGVVTAAGANPQVTPGSAPGAAPEATDGGH